MTTWSKTPPSEPGWYWWRTGHGDAPMPQWWDAKKAFPPWCEFGPRIPSPEDIEAAKDALREARGLLRVHTGAVQRAAADACDAALAKLGGR